MDAIAKRKSSLGEVPSTTKAQPKQGMWGSFLNMVGYVSTRTKQFFFG